MRDRDGERDETRAERRPPLLPGAGDTIAALATPLGRSALALLRMSGPAAHAIAERVLSPWRATPRSAYLATLRAPDTGAVVDRAVVTVYAAPRSYTGEDLVELVVHGGHVVPVLALSALFAAGAREALPGEFTRRAVLNGKMDVLQAEAVGDLIDARSRAMHDAALAQLDGSLSHRVSAIRAALLELEALLAYDIDFPEEDEGPVPAARVAAAADDLLGALDALLATAATGELVREGAVVVIAGAPNAGKSSLFNALLGVTRAIVTEVPGTTRDALEAVLDMGRWPVRLVDTAGLREASDLVERLGVEVSERYLRRADAVLVCGDDDPSLAAALARVAALTPAPLVAVRTKADLVASHDQIHCSAPLSASGREGASGRHLAALRDQSPPGASPATSRCAHWVSAATGAGLGEVVAAVERVLDAGRGAPSADVPLLTRERHRIAVARARDEVARFADAWRAGDLPATVAAVHLRAAAASLEELIGAVDVEDVLDRVFSSFCVGK